MCATPTGFIVGPMKHHSSLGLHVSAISFNPDFSVVMFLFILKRMCHKYIVLLFN